MHKLKLALTFLGLLCLCDVDAQFMDPEKPVTKKVNTVVKKDEFFPEIIPDHGGGGQEIVVIKEEIGVISNTVEKVVEQQVIISNTVEKVVEQQTIISNTVEKVVEQVVVFSNAIDQVNTTISVLSNDVAEVQEKKLDNNVESLTNSAEFVQAVQTVTPTSTNVWPKLEFEKAKSDIELYRTAFSQITNMNISAETNLEELKAAILKIRDAAKTVMDR